MQGLAACHVNSTKITNLRKTDVLIPTLLRSEEFPTSLEVFGEIKEFRYLGQRYTVAFQQSINY